MGTMTTGMTFEPHTPANHSDGTIVSANQRKAMVISLNKFSRARRRLRHSLDCDWLLHFLHSGDWFKTFAMFVVYDSHKTTTSRRKVTKLPSSLSNSKIFPESPNC